MPIRPDGETRRPDGDHHTPVPMVLSSSGTGSRHRARDHRHLCTSPDTRAPHKGSSSRIDQLYDDLLARHTHPEVLALCTPGLFERDNFEAAARCTENLLDRVRELTDQETLAPAALLDLAFKPGRTPPLLAMNTLDTPSDRAAQRGLHSLVKGLIDLYQRPSRFDPRDPRLVTDLELNELLATLSLVHRQLDRARGSSGLPEGRRLS